MKSLFTAVALLSLAGIISAAQLQSASEVVQFREPQPSRYQVENKPASLGSDLEWLSARPEEKRGHSPPDNGVVGVHGTG